MYIDFDKLPDKARVWVYQANRPLTDGDVKTIEEAFQPALNQWAAHGQPLLASAQVVENRFVVVGVDEGYACRVAVPLMHLFGYCRKLAVRTSGRLL